MERLLLQIIGGLIVAVCGPLLLIYVKDHFYLPRDFASPLPATTSARGTEPQTPTIPAPATTVAESEKVPTERTVRACTPRVFEVEGPLDEVATSAIVTDHPNKCITVHDGSTVAIGIELCGGRTASVYNVAVKTDTQNIQIEIADSKQSEWRIITSREFGLLNHNRARFSLMRLTFGPDSETQLEYEICHVRFSNVIDESGAG